MERQFKINLSARMDKFIFVRKLYLESLVTEIMTFHGIYNRVKAGDFVRVDCAASATPNRSCKAQFRQ